MTVYLIRHGRTSANERHLYCGSTDLPLSEAGKAALAARPPLGIKASRFITSGMRRCSETLTLLFGNVPYEVMDGFREIDFGAFEMKSYEELKNDPDYQQWLNRDPEISPPPGGESGTQMTERVLSAYQSVVQGSEDTVIVTHGGAIAAIMGSLFPEEGKNRYQWQPKPGEGYAISGNQYRSIP